MENLELKPFEVSQDDLIKIRDEINKHLYDSEKINKSVRHKRL